MASYSSYFNFGSGPTLKTGVAEVDGLIGDRWTAANTTYKTTYQYVAKGEQDKKAAAAFDAIMAGHDATSQAYVNKLSSIYDGYAKYAEEFGDAAKPIMEALTGDIGEMEGYIQEYGNVLDEVRPTMMDGINIDPSATRTREEYTGNVAAAFAKQREQAKQGMESQGMNPFANKGADRQLRLAAAAGVSDAANAAYKDWRTQYNNDMEAKAKLQGQYAGLVGQKGALQGQVMQARGGLIDANKSIMDAKISAGQAQASGVEGLLSLAEARRAEALKLGQQAQENSRYNDDMTQQLSAKLTAKDKQLGAF